MTAEATGLTGIPMGIPRYLGPVASAPDATGFTGIPRYLGPVASEVIKLEIMGMLN